MDSTISLDNLIKQVEAIGGEMGAKALMRLDEYKKHIVDTSSITLNFSEVLKIIGKEATASVHKLVEESQDLFNSFLKFTDVGQKVDHAIKEATSSISEIFKQSNAGISYAAVGTLDLFGLLNKNITGMGKLGESGLEASAKITTAFESVSPVFEKAFSDKPGLKNLITHAMEGRDRILSLEGSMISMALAQGKVSGVVDISAEKFKDLDEVYKQYVDMSARASEETGQTVSSIMELNKALASIPSAASNGENAVEVSRLAAAANMDQLKTTEQLANMYTRLGTRYDDAKESLAYMHDKAGDSKLRFEAFNDTVMTIAGSFKMLGDNTNATTNFVNAFDKAFADSKISPEAMKEVITDIGQGIEKMDVAKQAFISGASGGPGGLAGAAQIQELMATGHMDEVIKKTMTVMQAQFGGQIVTRKEAAENPALAGEWFKQTQYLTQTAGIAKDEKEANRILEAMKTGVMDMFKPGAAEGEKGLALQRQLRLGEGRQEETKEAKVLMGIHRTLELAGIQRDEINRKLIPALDKYMGKIVEPMGIIPSERASSGRGAITSGVNAFSSGKRKGEIVSRDWDEMYGEIDSGIRKKIMGGYESLLDKISGNNQSVKQTDIAPPPGAEAGVSNIAPGHRSDLGLPSLPDVHKITLPTVPTLGDNATTNPSGVEHSFKDMNVNLAIDLGDHKVFNEMIKVQIQQEDEALNRQRATGRR